MAQHRVGDYVLTDLLGEGGMGIVHLARRRSGGQLVALKVLRPQVVGDEQGRERLAREVETMERVHSPWVAEVVDADPWGEVPYVATQYVDGDSLHDVVDDRGPLREQELWTFAYGLAEGIAACHDVGVVHRDVKPSNVLLAGGRPVLIDFGLARVADDSRLTQTGFLLGTPGYLAPELVDGEEATDASDVHAWAATVAFAATGRAPFGSGPSAAVMDRTRRGEADLAGVAEPLRSVLGAALVPDPQRRPHLEAIIDWLTDPDAPSPVRGQHHLPGRPPPTSVLTELLPSGPTAVPERDPAADSPGPLRGSDREVGSVPEVGPDGSRRVGFSEGVRRGVFRLASLLVVFAAISAFPVVGSVVVAVLAWVFAATALGAASLASRRAVRGQRWYDALGAVVASPWYLVRSLLPTLKVALVSWGAGVAVYLLGWLLGRADGLEDTVTPGRTLLVAVAFAVVLLGLGPGSRLARRTATSVTGAVSVDWRGWLVLTLVLLAAAAWFGWNLQTYDAQWWPLPGVPLGWV